MNKDLVRSQTGVAPQPYQEQFPRRKSDDLTNPDNTRQVRYENILNEDRKQLSYEVAVFLMSTEIERLVFENT